MIELPNIVWEKGKIQSLLNMIGLYVCNMRTYKRMCAMFLSLFTFVASNSQIAMAQETYNPTCVETINYDYTTDAAEMIQLINEVNVCNTENLSASTEILEDGSIVLKQLISESVYSDGSVEKTYAATNIELFDYNPQSKSVENKSYTDSWGYSDIACYITAYYTVESGGRSIHSVSFSYTKNGSSSINVRKTQMYSHGIYDALDPDGYIERYATYNYPSPNVIYNLNTDDDRVYNSSYTCQFNVGAVVTFSDGTVSDDYDLMIFLEQLEAVW